MPKAYLYHSETRELGEAVEADATDVYFPESIGGWTNVLDCRISPYDSQSIDENCAFALGVRKPYILVGEGQVVERTPPSSAD